MKQSIVTRKGLLLGCLVLWAGCAAETGSNDVGQAESAITGAGGIEAVVTVSSSWQGGYCANVTVANKGTTATRSWTGILDLAGGTLASSWNVNLAGTGNTRTFTPISWAAQLQPAASTSFGFCANSASSTRAQITSISADYGSGGAGGAGASGGAGGTAGTGTAGGGTSGAVGGAGGTGAAGAGATGGGGTSPTGTPVALHGQLKVVGTKLVDKNGVAVQLKGLSSMWLNWESKPYAENLEGMRWARDNWKLSVVRAAMGVEPSGAYLSDPAKAKTQINQIVQNAITLGIYVIIDWHDHNAQNHQAQSVAFFSEMAQKWGAYPNVLYETFNEPLQVSWSSVLKPYHQAVVNAIRAKDPDNIAILGTPQWSQRVDDASRDKLAGTNLMYTLHFYSCTHGASLRSVANTALGAGLPIFLTEWGATNADGGLDGKLCLSEAQLWHDWMNQNSISWAAWKFDACTPDSSCILKGGAPVTGGWTDQWLFGHGSFVRDRMMK